MSAIGDWLVSLGLGEYTAAFERHNIDVDLLSEVNDQALKEIGIYSAGHRLRIRTAIAKLTTRSAPVDSAPRPTVAAERRHVTVMFTDLVGSTALSTRLDPEDLRAVIGAYLGCVAETIARFDGFVAKYMGDGVLIYFGYPQAHEDDAERAVRAGLALIDKVAALAAAEPLQVRIGIATGLVVVGDLIGSGESQERGIVGETPNLAARLQGAAAPNQVVIDEGTRRLLGGLFELQDFGAKELKGIAGPAQAWAALRARPVESRFDALHAAGPTALIGREEEVDLLRRRWAKAQAGAGEVVLISGEAGIGKSRLTAALIESLADEPHGRLRYFCSPQHTDSALYPIIGQMERAAGFSHDDTPQAKLAKLDTLLTQTATSAEDMMLLAEMLSLPHGDPTLERDPPLRREKTLAALVVWVEALALQGPVLGIFEDAHWIDPTSLELLGRAVERVAHHRILLLVTSRPEFEPTWVGRPYVTKLTINRLEDFEIAAMIDAMVGSKELPPHVRQDIVERTDGIPLFVEEMTKAVLEAERERNMNLTDGVASSPVLTVPASLHASLMARLDRLGPAKDVAQIGAAIGREFSHPLIAAVTRKPEAEVNSALDRLIRAGLLFRQGVPPHASYLFKHALVQDAAYGTLLREPRRELHARIATMLEDQFVDIAEMRPELVARHCTEAHLTEKAATLWGKAGQRSLERSALVEAIEQLNRALAQIATLPATADLRREEIKLQVACINPLMHVKGHAAPETKAAAERARLLIERAEALNEPLEDPLLLFSVLYGFWVANLIAFDGDVMRELGEQFLALAEKQKATVPLMIGHRLVATTHMCMGRFAPALTHYDRALALYDPGAHRALATRFGHDNEVASLTYRSWAHWSLGYPEAALAGAEQALAGAQAVGVAPTLMFAMFHAAICRLECGNYAAANALLGELIPLAEEKGALFWKAHGLSTQGWLFALGRKPRDAVQIITGGIAAWRSMGSTAFVPTHLAYLAKAHADLGEFDAGWRCIGEALCAVEKTKETWWEAEIHRIAGELALMAKQADAAKAQASFERALSIARDQQAKSWELRAALSLARLWHEQGKRKEARDLLAPVYNWFTEGFDTRDLKAAKALLDELTA